jgi:hypothetical protein
MRRKHFIHIITRQSDDRRNLDWLLHLLDTFTARDYTLQITIAETFHCNGRLSCSTIISLGTYATIRIRNRGDLDLVMVYGQYLHPWYWRFVIPAFFRNLPEQYAHGTDHEVWEYKTVVLEFKS